MITPEIWKTVGYYASSSWTAIGPLVGVLVGAYITGKRQKRDWVANNKKEEYRELLAAMTRTLSTCLHLHNLAVLSDEDQKKLVTVSAELMETTRSRIFIAERIKQMNVVRRWFDMTMEFERTRDNAAFAKGTGALLDEIIETALKDVND